MPKKSNQPATGPIQYGFISPDGVGYPISNGDLHAQWIFDNYDFIKNIYPDFPSQENLKYSTVEDIRYELIRRGWLGVGMDRIVYVGNLKREKRKVIDAILMGVIVLPYKLSPVRVLDYSKDAFSTRPYTYEDIEELEYYGSKHVPILYRIADVTQGSGFWIAPNNEMYSIRGSHIEWVRDNVGTLRKYFDAGDTKDPGQLFMKAFENGFVRFRTEYDDNDDPSYPDGKIISSISANDIGRIKSLPSMAKSMIAYSNEINFYDMSNNAQMTVIPEDEISKYTEYSSPDKRLKSNLKILFKLAKLRDEEGPISAPKPEEIVDKGWISPDGKTYNTFHAFHAGWIADHFDWLNDRVPLGNKQEVVRKSNDPSGAYHLRQLLIKSGWVAAYDAFRTINFFSNGDSRSLRNIEEAILLRQVPQKDFYSVQNINNDKLEKYTIEEIKESGMNKMASKTPEWVTGKPPVPGVITGEKGWISPEGETYVVDTTFHAGFIAQHFDWFKNKYHLDYSAKDMKSGSEEGGRAATIRNDIVKLGWIMAWKDGWSNRFSFYTDGSSKSLNNIQDAILLRKIVPQPSRINVFDVVKNSSEDYSTSQIMEEGLVMAKNNKNIKISQLDIRPAGCDYISLELDLIHKQHQQEDKDLLKFFFILDYILKKSDIDANVHEKVMEKYKELKDTIEFDAYSQEWLDKLSHIDTSEVNNILALIS